MTLLLGPPGCGKSTLLRSLSGSINKDQLQVNGEISYNGYKLEEFVTQKTSAYISQYDLQIAEITVRETLDFSAECQGVGNKNEMMLQLIQREKEAGIVPAEHDIIDLYMKATAVEGLRRSLQTDYILRILGLDMCSDMLVGNTMRRGISGGEKKRLTTGEMIVGPTRTLFMDEISTGLDSSTAFQIVKCIQQFVHITKATVLMSLLQPAPETFELFDDIILMAEGKAVYHGPCTLVLSFFEHCGFKCPKRKSAADFLQEVISAKDQAQYWSKTDQPYKYVTIDQFKQKFEASEIGQKLSRELSKPHNQSLSNKDALAFSNKVDSLSSKWKLLKACMRREVLLMKRNAFIYVFKITQLLIIACITMTIFLRTRMPVNMIGSSYYMDSMFFAILVLLVNGFPELVMTVDRLPVFFKHRDFYFYPAWAYAIPATLLKIPLSFVESLIWTAVTYYGIGYSPEAGRFVTKLAAMGLLGITPYIC